MRAHKISLGLFLASLLAGASPAALAGPFDQQATGAGTDEVGVEASLVLDLDPSLLLEPSKESPFGRGFALAAPPAVTGPAFPADEAQSAIARAIKSGYSVAIEPEHFPAELNRGYAVTESFKAGIRAGFDAPVGDDMRLATAGAEARLALGQIGPAISWGWHTGIDMSVRHDGTSAVASGPRFKLGGDRLALTLSPKVAHTFGADHGSDVAFAYAAGLKSEIAKGVALGIEAFGATSDIAAASGTALQTYRTSPGLYVGLGLTPPQKGDPKASTLSLEIGALADMTETHPDWTGKLKAAVTW